MKGPSEATIRDALAKLRQEMRLVIYKPPDDARNWKPADFLLWYRPALATTDLAYSHPVGAFLEVKQTDQVDHFPLADLRINQRAAIRDAGRVGAPFVLAIWWPKHQPARWTIGDAAKLVAELDGENGRSAEWPTSIVYDLLASRYGVDCEPRHLVGTLGAMLRGEVG